MSRESAIGGAAAAPGWQRLGASFTASLALHACAIVLILMALPPLTTRSDRADPPLVVRLVEPPPQAQPKAVQPKAAQPRVPRPQKQAGPRRVGYVYAQPAYQDLERGFEMEKLDARQRSVPRSIDLPRPAEPRTPIRPAYPRDALARGERASVLVEAFIGANGVVENVVLLDDGGAPHFAQVSLDALRRTRWRPAESAAGKARSRVTLRFTFQYE